MKLDVLKRLTKSNLITFVVISTLAGFGLSLRVEKSFDLQTFILLLVGVSLISAGSFALNQWQEADIDSLMARTRSRPLPQNEISRNMALLVSILFIGIGEALLFLIHPLPAILGAITILLYNGFYTLLWKRSWIYGAIPGAIPGAMPVVIGYSANSENIFHLECVYAFLIMFMWQMPHFWSLALRYKEDYRKGGIPTLPVAAGDGHTLYFIGIYMFIYVMLAVASPWVVEASWIYLILVVPFAIKVVVEFNRYFKAQGQEHWLRFFLWTNFSMLAFLIAPVLDRWVNFYMEMH